MITDDVQRLREQGWFLTETSSDDELLELSGILGTPVRSRTTTGLIDELRPIPKSQAQPCSLSARHGIGAFPLHTDTAYWHRPARYVLLRAAVVDERSGSTLIKDSRSIQLSATDRCLLKRAVFGVRSGRGSFLTTIVSEDEKVFRFDRDCMFPKGLSGVQASMRVGSAEASSAAVEIHWTVNRTLVLDNWRFLHGRSDGDGTDTSRRLLQRVLVTEKTNTWR
jgi:alpha-ketoglutarate-dependent taurine dioxygenase